MERSRWARVRARGALSLLRVSPGAVDPTVRPVANSTCAWDAPSTGVTSFDAVGTCSSNIEIRGGNDALAVLNPNRPNGDIQPRTLESKE